MSHPSAPVATESESTEPTGSPERLRSGVEASPPSPETAGHAGGAETASTCRHCRRAKNPPSFHPTERQRQLAEILATDKDALTITSLCEKAGVTRNTFYRWQRDTQFQLWLARIAMQTLLATSPMLLMQGVNDALNGDFRAWRTMLNFAYNPRGLAALDAFLARLEENARVQLRGQPDTSETESELAFEEGGSTAETVANSGAGEPSTPPATSAGATITTAARVLRDLRQSGAKSHTPAPAKPKFEVSYKYTPPPPKQGDGLCANGRQSHGLCADQSPPSNEATVSHSPAAAEPDQPAARVTAEQSSISPSVSTPQQTVSTSGASLGPQPDVPYPAAEISALVERARKLTPTEIAKSAFNGEFGLVKLALSEGADPNSRDDVYGVSALSAAAVTGKIEVMRLLLRRGADVHARDNQGRTALDHARRQNQRAAVELLLEAGAR